MSLTCLTNVTDNIKNDTDVKENVEDTLKNKNCYLRKTLTKHDKFYYFLFIF